MDTKETLTAAGETQSMVNRLYPPPPPPPASGPPDSNPPLYGDPIVVSSHVYAYNTRGERSKAEREDGRLWGV